MQMQTIRHGIRRSNREANHVTHGNVFDDLGFSPKKAVALKIKADLHRKIVKRAEQFSQRELQSMFSETQARVSHLLHGKIASFTLDMLIFYADRLGIHAELKTRESKMPAHSRFAVVAAR
jgi:predicted XRE-type DNA-binding protein